MDDYIKRSDAIKTVCDDCEYYSTNDCEDCRLDRLTKITAADVRPVVLCRDCRWWTKQEKSLQGRCELAGFYPTGEWFCANGERSNCGSDMMEPNLDTTKGDNHDQRQRRKNRICKRSRQRYV
jgi:hypothetical protein